MELYGSLVVSFERGFQDILSLIYYTVPFELHGPATCLIKENSRRLFHFPSTNELESVIAIVLYAPDEQVHLRL